MTPAPLSPAALARGDTPRGKRRRREQLRAIIHRIREAEFPREYKQFLQWADVLREETFEGRRVQKRWFKYAVDNQRDPELKNLSTDCPARVFLPLLQADLATAEARRWDHLIADIRAAQEKRKEAANNPVPAKAARLFAEAEREQGEALARLKSELDGTAAYKEFAAAIPAKRTRPRTEAERKQRLREKQHAQDAKPRLPRVGVCWSKPMTRAEYVAATGKSPKTIKRFLAKIGASTMKRRRRVTDPGRYFVEVNLEVLVWWIEQVDDDKQAADFAAATLAYAAAQDRAFVPRLARALYPVLKKRGLIAPLADAIEAHRRYYAHLAAPPPAPLPSWIQELVTPAAP